MNATNDTPPTQDDGISHVTSEGTASPGTSQTQPRPIEIDPEPQIGLPPAGTTGTTWTPPTARATDGGGTTDEQFPGSDRPGGSGLEHAASRQDNGAGPDRAPQTQTAPAPVPSVGRIVRYVLPIKSRNAHHQRAAIISDVEDDDHGGTLTLGVFKAHQHDLLDYYHDDPTTPTPNCILGSDEKSATGVVAGVRYDPSGEQPGTWHWPPTKPGR